MEWYAPLTVLPAIGLLILSTSNFIVALNNEINGLLHEPERRKVLIGKKLAQLKRLSVASAFLYFGVILFLTSGLTSAFSEKEIFFKLQMAAGVLVTTVAVVILFFYSTKAVAIRQSQLDSN